MLPRRRHNKLRSIGTESLSSARRFPYDCSLLLLHFLLSLSSAVTVAGGFATTRRPSWPPSSSSSSSSLIRRQASLSPSVEKATTNNSTAERPDLNSLLYDQEEYEAYSRCLSPKEERENVVSEGNEFANKKRKRGPISFVQNLLPRRRKRRPGSLILIRCGESEYNANRTFTGWLDPDLTSKGIQECRRAGQLLLEEGYDVDVVYTSRLKRAIKSAWTVLTVLDALYVPVYKTFRLNQRMYGALQGLSKRETASKIGSAAVASWRNKRNARPPPLRPANPTHPIHDRRYADLLPAGGANADGTNTVLPSSETLYDCQERARPLWEHKIRRDIQYGKNVLVVAHRDTLKGLIKEIDQISDNDIEDIQLPNGIPFVYKFDTDLVPIDLKDDGTDAAAPAANFNPHSSGVFLEKEERLHAVMAHQETWRNDRFVSGERNNDNELRRDTTLRESLRRLRIEQDLPVSARPTNNNAIPRNVPPASQIQTATTAAKNPAFERWTDDPCEFEEYDFFAAGVEEDDDDFVSTVRPNIVSIPREQQICDDAENTQLTSNRNDGSYVVLIRHGRTPHNNLGLFTGWEDPPLAEEGVQDAINAGRLLKLHNFEFDVCYTSWLTRAIQTAFYAIDEMDCVWLPMVKSWRLNERMYGDLTGKSKKRVANEHGEEQLKKWRRGYTVRPPPVSSYSLNYPGNDIRRAQHFDDLPVSWKETITRSVEQRKFALHRKFPKTESLKDCMDRSIPFYTKRIREEAVKKGKRVLITSHENALRGILMHLCDIPEYAMNQLHLPNGLPLVYNVKGKCISLLDDGTGKDQMEVHDFGPAAKYLFKPCQIDDEFYDSMQP